MDIRRRFPGATPALVGLVLLGACVDQPMEPPLEERPVIGAAIRCIADVGAETVTCGDGAPAANAGLSILVGGYDSYTRILPTRVFFNEDTRTLHSWMAVQSLVIQPLGTPDGSSPTGVRVLVTSPPAAAAGRGDVSILNPDGTADGTARGQPYFAYDGILRQWESTTAKRWAFRVEPGVERFEFQLLVDAQIPLPNGVLRWSYPWMGGLPRRPWGTGTTIYAASPGVLRSTDGGATWQSHPIPGVSIVDLWGDADSAVYVAGHDAHDSTVILRAEAGRWREWARIGASRSAFQAVWGSSATDLYGIRADSIFHSTDGRTWTGGAVAGGPNVLVRRLNRIWGSGSDHVYAAGWEVVGSPLEARGLLLHSGDGGRTWGEHRFSRLAGSSYTPEVRLNTVWGPGDGHVWVGGFSTGFRGFIAHSADYGASWTEYDVGETIVGIWGTSPENMYAVDNLHGAYAFNGTRWFPLHTGGERLHRGFTDVWGSSDGSSIVLFGDSRWLYRGVR